MVDQSLTLTERLRVHKLSEFPPQTGRDELDEIHADLAHYDNDVVGAISHAIGGAAVDERLFARGEEIRQALSTHLDREDPEIREAAVTYAKYLDELTDLLQQAMGSPPPS